MAFLSPAILTDSKMTPLQEQVRWSQKKYDEKKSQVVMTTDVLAAYSEALRCADSIVKAPRPSTPSESEYWHNLENWSEVHFGQQPVIRPTLSSIPRVRRSIPLPPKYPVRVDIKNLIREDIRKYFENVEKQLETNISVQEQLCSEACVKSMFVNRYSSEEPLVNTSAKSSLSSEGGGLITEKNISKDDVFEIDDPLSLHPPTSLLPLHGHMMRHQLFFVNFINQETKIFTENASSLKDKVPEGLLQLRASVKSNFSTWKTNGRVGIFKGTALKFLMDQRKRWGSNPKCPNYLKYFLLFDTWAKYLANNDNTVLFDYAYLLSSDIFDEFDGMSIFSYILKIK